MPNPSRRATGEELPCTVTTRPWGSKLMPRTDDWGRPSALRHAVTRDPVCAVASTTSAKPIANTATRDARGEGTNTSYRVAEISKLIRPVIGAGGMRCPPVDTVMGMD